jgi:hypothetical protein
LASELSFKAKGGRSMQRYLIALLIVLVAGPALATEFYVAKNPKTNACRVVETKPDGKKRIMVGTKSYPTLAEARVARRNAPECPKRGEAAGTKT